MPSETPEPQTVVVLGTPFHNVTFPEAVEWVRARIAARRPAYIATANVDFLMQAWRDPELQRILLEADLVVADGVPILWMSRLLGPALRERVTGSDLVPLLSEMAAANGYSIFNLGGAPGVPEKAAEVLTSRFPGLRVAGCYSPPKADILDMNHQEILARLEQARPDLLFIAYGAPKQEKFANMHVRQWSVPVAMGIGGSLDFLAGAQKRAPKLVQRMALEWLWRMFSDPRRLVGRYIKNILFFFSAAVRLLGIRLSSNRHGGGEDQTARATLGAAAHVEPFERLRTAAQAAAFQSRMAALAAHTAVALDLCGTDWLSSLDMGALLRVAGRFRQQGRIVVLFGLGARIERLLAFCRLNAYLELASSAGAAAQRIAQFAVTSMDVRIEQDATGRATLRLPPELTAVNAGQVERHVADTASLETAPGWVVEASATRFVDSTGIGLLVRLKKRASDLGIPVRFTGWQPRVLQTLRIARVEAVLASPAA